MVNGWMLLLKWHNHVWTNFFYLVAISSISQDFVNYKWKNYYKDLNHLHNYHEGKNKWLLLTPPLIIPIIPFPLLIKLPCPHFISCLFLYVYLLYGIKFYVFIILLQSKDWKCYPYTTWQNHVFLNSYTHNVSLFAARYRADQILWI